jgi:hypothetical protein
LQDDFFKMLPVLIYPHFARNSMSANAHSLVGALAHTNSDTLALQLTRNFREHFDRHHTQAAPFIADII